MKILTIHADFISFEAKKKAIKTASDDLKSGPQRVEECLVVFTAVEKRDEAGAAEIALRYVQEIKDIAQQVKTRNVVLYPYAHLSSQLSAPAVAEKVLEEAQSLLKKEKYVVTRAPFGWYKSFTISCKGHPLSELSREFTAEGRVRKENAPSVPPEEPFDRENLLKRLSKNTLSAEPGKGGLKSNVELGKELDLYIVNEVIGSGLPLLTPRGATLKREIERFIVDEELRRGYLHTSTPVLARSDLYKISGHWQHYRENMFTVSVGNETFALRPMTCPFQFTLYKSQPHSYRELPLKYAEIASLFRNEKSGELMGLTRIRQFTLADAHIICTPDQLAEQFSGVIDLIHFVTKTLQMDGLWYRFSLWDPQNREKYVDNPAAWESTQAAMKRILDTLKIKYVEAKNETAFYGPKLDIQYKNVFGKEDTLLTVQIDFALPERFDLTYVDENNEKKRPLVIHRSSVGCLERTMAYLLEKTQGNLPLWLNPLQVKVVTVNDASLPLARKVVVQFREQGIRAELDDAAETIGKKIRNAQLEKANYIVTLGDKEVKKNVLAIRTREGKVTFDVPLASFMSQLLQEIRQRK